MGVLTEISFEEMGEIFSHYYNPEEYELVSSKPTAEGVSNSNYIIEFKKIVRE